MSLGDTIHSAQMRPFDRLSRFRTRSGFQGAEQKFDILAARDFGKLVGRLNETLIRFRTTNLGERRTGNDQRADQRSSGNSEPSNPESGFRIGTSLCRSSRRTSLQ